MLQREGQKSDAFYRMFPRDEVIMTCFSGTMCRMMALILGLTDLKEKFRGVIDERFIRAGVEYVGGGWRCLSFAELSHISYLRGPNCIWQAQRSKPIVAKVRSVMLRCVNLYDIIQ